MKLKSLFSSNKAKSKRADKNSIQNSEKNEPSTEGNKIIQNINKVN